MNDRRGDEALKSALRGARTGVRGKSPAKTPEIAMLAHLRGIRGHLERAETQILSQIFDELDCAFNESELRNLCFGLGIRYDALPGDTLPDVIRSLIDFADRHGRLDELVVAYRKERPNLQ